MATQSSFVFRPPMPFIIHRKPPYRVYVEEGHGGATAHVAELPGCFTMGTDASRAVAAMPRAIIVFLAWLRRHREPLVPEAYVSRPSVADLFVADVRPEDASLLLFAADKAAWDDDKLERTLRWLSYSRADLLARTEGLDETILKSRQIALGRTLWDTLLHIANTEYGYMNMVSGPLDSVGPTANTEPIEALEWLTVERSMFEKWARSIPSETRGEVVYPEWSSKPNEAWTLAKALRRALEHELRHLAEVSPSR